MVVKEQVLGIMEIQLPFPFLGSSHYRPVQFQELSDALCFNKQDGCSHFPPLAQLGLAVCMFALFLVYIMPTKAEPEKDQVNWKSVRTHDTFNLFVLPVITILATLGTLGVISSELVANTMSVYMAVDYFWIYFFPSCIISKAKLILTHHAVVLFMTLGCVFVNVEYAYNASWALLVEFNTGCLILSRFPKVKGSFLGKFVMLCFWVSLVLFRVLLPPWQLWHYMTIAPQMHPAVRLLFVACQFLLCCFNVYFVYQRLLRDRVPDDKEDKSKDN